MDLSFLKNVTVSAAPVAQKAPAASRAKQRQPEGEVTTIRLFKDGSVYPSAHLVQLMDLEYGKRGEDNKAVGNGIDIIDSRDMKSQFDSPTPFVGVAFVPRAQGKVDLFASCQYDKVTGEPLSDVGSQGSSTYGKEQLIPLLQSVYGDSFAFNEEGYVDLDILDEDFGLTSPDGRFFIFKRVSRGDNKGQKDYAVRTNVTIYPLVPKSAETDTVVAGDPEASAALLEVETGRAKDKVKAGKATATAGGPFGDDNEDPGLDS